MALDMIDLDGDPGQQAESLARACESIGFFRLPLSVIARPVADAAWDSAAEFFTLPDDWKRRVEFPEPGYPYGYSPFGFDSLAKSLDGQSPATPDLKESLSVGPDAALPPTTEPVAPLPDADDAWIRSPCLWPKQPRLMNPWRPVRG